MRMRDKYLNLAREQKILWNMRVTVIPIVSGALETVPEKLGRETHGTGNQKKKRNHPDNRIAENG